MGSTIANYGEWDFLYANALLEPDGNRLKERITAAEAAINERLKALANCPSSNPETAALIVMHSERSMPSRLSEVGQRTPFLTESSPKAYVDGPYRRVRRLPFYCVWLPSSGR